MRLPMFAFPFSGGGGHAFAPLASQLERVELITLEYPGRGRRIREPLLTDAAALAADTLTRIRSRLEAPYALFGHSLGAHVLALALERIEREKLHRPAFAVVAGAAAPTVRTRSNDHLLSDDAFVSLLRKIGGAPEEMLSSPELLELFLPILRADFQAAEDYDWPSSTRFESPIVCLTGADDPDVGPDDLAAWRALANGAFDAHELPGGHFFVISESPAAVAQLLDGMALRLTARA